MGVNQIIIKLQMLSNNNNQVDLLMILIVYLVLRQEDHSLVPQLQLLEVLLSMLHLQLLVVHHLVDHQQHLEALHLEDYHRLQEVPNLEDHQQHLEDLLKDKIQVSHQVVPQMIL